MQQPGVVRQRAIAKGHLRTCRIPGGLGRTPEVGRCPKKNDGGRSTLNNCTPKLGSFVRFVTQIDQEKWNSLGSFLSFSVFVRFEPMVLEVSKVSLKILGVFRKKWMWVKFWDQGSIFLMFLRLGIQRPSLTHTQIPALVYQDVCEGNHVILWFFLNHRILYISCFNQSITLSVFFGGSKTGKEPEQPESLHDWQWKSVAKAPHVIGLQAQRYWIIGTANVQLMYSSQTGYQIEHSEWGAPWE